MRRLNIQWNRDELVALYHGKNMSLDEVAAHFGCNPESVRKAMKNLGIDRKPPVNRTDRPHPKKARKMEANGFWKDGTTTDVDGYRMIKTPGHPFANSGGYVREHRLVMEKTLGRYLTREEVVHHKDDDPTNNAASNLELYASNAEHLAATLKGKCPKWSEAGFQNMLQSANRKALIGAATREALKIYAQRHNVELAHLLASLSRAERALLRKALRRGDFEYQPASWKGRATVFPSASVPPY